MTQIADHGAWRSPITPQVLVSQVVGLGYPNSAGGRLYWLESRPSEGGRQTVVGLTPGGREEDLLPPEMSARTLVHEYGGQCHVVDGDRIYFCNFEDQRIYRLDRGSVPVPITPKCSNRQLRYADLCLCPDGSRLVCVRERHLNDGVVNDLVSVPTDGSEEPQVVASGHDFFSSPRLDPAARRIAWLCWDHPRMPWDGTELWEAQIDDRLVPTGTPSLIAGGEQESVSQPRYSPDGVLHYVSDRSGWWNLYARHNGSDRCLAPKPAEFSGPDWMFGQSTYAFLPDGSIAAVWSEKGFSRLGLLRSGDTEPHPIELGFSVIGSLAPAAEGVVAIVASPTQEPAVATIAIPSGSVRIAKKSREASVDDGYLSEPRPIEFPTDNNEIAHALYYPPRNRDFTGPAGQKPPLLVMSHGGPTAATSPALSYKIQFWTSRGIAVADVNYRGSTGYGRAYRRALDGVWGIADVNDCVNAALWLAERGEVDADKLMIRGGSAGGYTTLRALTTTDEFACGASLYGVADACALAEDTHKFESRYLDGLIGPWPQSKPLYQERSPINHTDRLGTPLILFQGSEDEIVPPEQSRMMADALRRKGVPYAYLEYEGEQHGFRKAENIMRTAEAELSFYGQILGFQPAGEITPVAVVR